MADDGTSRYTKRQNVTISDRLKLNFLIPHTVLSAIVTTDGGRHCSCLANLKCIYAISGCWLGNCERDEIQTKNRRKIKRKYRPIRPLFAIENCNKITYRIWQIGFFDCSASFVSVLTVNEQEDGASIGVDGFCQ